jgi:hypothetical protein
VLTLPALTAKARSGRAGFGRDSRRTHSGDHEIATLLFAPPPRWGTCGGRLGLSSLSIQGWYQSLARLRYKRSTKG